MEFEEKEPESEGTTEQAAEQSPEQAVAEPTESEVPAAEVADGLNEAARPADSESPSGDQLKSILESLLFAAGEPVSLTQLANALDDVPRDEIRKALNEMAMAYTSAGRGLLLEEIAGGYQLRTAREHGSYVRRLLAARPPRLSRPLLETLAIIAYRQPITRAEIEQLRGVDTGGVLDTLVERGLIKIAGRKEAPGRPIIYATTSDFLELFSLKGLDSLPNLEEFRELEALRDPADLDRRMAEGKATAAVESADGTGQDQDGNPAGVPSAEAEPRSGDQPLETADSETATTAENAQPEPAGEPAPSEAAKTEENQ